MSVNPGYAAAIAGLGMTEMTREYTKSAAGLAAEAIRLAIDDAGLAKEEVDGLLINAGVTQGLSTNLQRVLGMRDLRLVNHMNGQGSTAGQMVQFASLAIHAGMANVVACVFADAPLRAGTSAGAAYGGGGGGGGGGRPAGLRGLGAAYGFFGANTSYALAARRHMALYGTTHDQLGAIAVSNRKWAGMNPAAMQRAADDARRLPRLALDRRALPPAGLHARHQRRGGRDRHQRRTRARAAPAARLRAGDGAGTPGQPGARGLRERGPHRARRWPRRRPSRWPASPSKTSDVCEFYDCYTYTTLVTLEDYGFCEKGRAVPSSKTAGSRRGAHCPRTRAAASSPGTTCGA